MGIRCTDHVTPFYPQKLTLTSPTGGGRSVGIVRSRTKATEFSLVYASITSYAFPDTYLGQIMETGAPAWFLRPAVAFRYHKMWKIM